jgi:hypothetical protein
MQQNNESNGFLNFMNILFFAIIGICFLGILIAISKLPEGSGGLALAIFIAGLIQILVLINLIVLNKRSMRNTSDLDDDNSASTIENGLFEQFYDNGNAKVRGNYLNGKKEGVWEYFYFDGSSNGTKTFKNGKEIST